MRDTIQASSWSVIFRYAELLGVKPAAREKWRQRGVAHRWRLPIIEAARADGVVIDLATFDRPAGFHASRPVAALYAAMPEEAVATASAPRSIRTGVRM